MMALLPGGGAAPALLAHLPGLASQAGELAQQSCNPITDTRASAEYRRMLVSALIRKSILQITTLK